MKQNKLLFTRLGIILVTMSLLFGTFGQSIMVPSVKAQEAQQTEILFLSELDWESASDGQEEEPEINASTDGNVLTLTDNNGNPVEFEKGIGTEANSEIIYDISELDYRFLTTWVGVDREVLESNASLTFEVFVDDILKYESKVMNDTTPMEYATIDISGADSLKLVVSAAGDSTGSNHGNWADIKLHQNDPILRVDNDIKQYEGMKLIFNEEFEGDELDTNLWKTLPWPENGSHHYANTIGKDENIWVEDGNLVIQAKPYEGDGDYKTTSGHIVTHGNFDFRYGRVDVRAKIPTETGMWPAIWMMASQQDHAWPMEGEIDIMELISQRPNQLFSTVHSGISGPNYKDFYFNEGGIITIDQGTYYDDYHVYSLEWEPGVLRFYDDDRLIHELTDWENWILDEAGEVVARDFPAPFDQDFHIKLNLATGGNWAIDVDDTTRYGDRTSMKVDYVRVYQEETPDYNFAEDEPFVNGKQGAVWYAQKNNNGTWENFEEFDSISKTWTTSENDAHVAPNSIGASFDAAAIALRAPYEGYVKVSLKNEVALDNDSEVTFNVTQGDMGSTQSDVLRTETITTETKDLSAVKTYLPVAADDMIRFEILTSDNVVKGFDPVVEYITEEEYNAYVNLEAKVKELENTDTTDFTSSSVTDFEVALNAAYALLKGIGYTEDYNNAVVALTEAFEALSEEDTSLVDKSLLEEAINKAKEIDTTNNTTETVAALEQAILDAEAVLNDEGATTEEIDKQLKALEKAIEGLEDNPQAPAPVVDKSKLEEKVKEAKTVETADKTSESVKRLKEAITAAELILEDDEATEDDVNQALERLKDALSKLETVSVDDEETADNNDNSNGTPVDQGSNGEELPKTATTMYNWLLFGLLLTGAGTFVLFKKKKA